MRRPRNWPQDGKRDSKRAKHARDMNAVVQSALLGDALGASRCCLWPVGVDSFVRQAKESQRRLREADLGLSFRQGGMTRFALSERAATYRAMQAGEKSGIFRGHHRPAETARIDHESMTWKHASRTCRLQPFRCVAFG